MVNVIWMIMIIIGIIFAMLNGKMGEVNEAILTSADEAISIVIGLTSILIFWLGMMKIAEGAGLLNKLSALLSPAVKKLFPEIPANHPAMGYILANFSANLFGLGNAATPLGIKAMKEMKKLSQSDKASNSMITFLVINTSSITLIPTTVIGIRLQYGSTNPTEIVGVTLIATVITTISALIVDWIFRQKRRRWE